MAIQIIAGDEIANLAEFFRQEYSDLVDRHHETMLPYTRVLRNFIGDRYGDDGLGEIPRNADYAAQLELHREPAYYWWLHPAGGSDAVGAAQAALPATAGVESGPADNQDFVIEFRIDGNCDQYVGSGWSGPEEAHRWAVGTESELHLPAFPAGDYLLLIWLGAYVDKTLVPHQRLRIQLNDEPIAELELASEAKLGLEIPRGILSETQGNLVRFIHPDAASPSQTADDPEDADDRELAIALMKLVLRRMSPKRRSQSAALERSAQSSSAAAAALVQAGAHIQERGDVWRPGKWAGFRDDELWIEGVMLSPGPEIEPDEIEYAAVLSNGTLTEWSKGGEFCGSRGANTPLLGLRVRLLGDCARKYRCSLSATFTDGSELEPLEGSYVVCQAVSLSPLQAFRFELRPLVPSTGFARPPQSVPASNKGVTAAPVPNAGPPAQLAFPPFLLSGAADAGSVPLATWAIREEPVPTLDAIGLKHRSDKSSSGQGYLEFYARFFEALRNARISLLVIGVGSGQSLRMWQEYFRAATIVGVDADPAAVRHEGGRVRIELGDQSQIADFTRIARKHGPFDIVVDDGSHLRQHRITTLQNLYPSVRDGGFYVLEDLHTGYRDPGGEFQGSADLSAAKYLQRFCEFLVGEQELQASDSADPFIRSHAPHTEFVALHRGTAILKRRG
jgi:hypothetical protein